MESVGVAIIGGGQAGLAVSCMLSQLAVDHVVLERGRVGQRWRDRWDGFCLVTPNWSIRLPGFSYSGPDPDGYLPRDEIASYLDQYAASFAAPVREQVEVPFGRLGGRAPVRPAQFGGGSCGVGGGRRDGRVSASAQTARRREPPEPT